MQILPMCQGLSMSYLLWSSFKHLRELHFSPFYRQENWLREVVIWGSLEELGLEHSVWFQCLFSFYSSASATQSQPMWLQCRCQSNMNGSLPPPSAPPWGRSHSLTCLQECMAVIEPNVCCTGKSLCYALFSPVSKPRMLCSCPGGNMGIY